MPSKFFSLSARYTIECPLCSQKGTQILTFWITNHRLKWFYFPETQCTHLCSGVRRCPCHVGTLSTSIKPGVQGLEYRRCSINGDCHSQVQRFHIPSLTSSVRVTRCQLSPWHPGPLGLNFAALTFQGGRSHGT